MASAAAGSGGPQLTLRPMGVSEIFDETFRIYRSNFALLASLGVASEIPALLSSFLSGGARNQGQILGAFTQSGSLGRQVTQNPSINPVLVLVGYAILLVTAPVVYAVIYQTAMDIIAGTKPSFVQVLTKVMRRYWAIAGMLGLFLLAILPVFTCLLIPVTIWLYIRWSVAFPAMFAEGKGPVGALERSTALAENNWWRMFGILLLGEILVIVVSIAVGAILGLLVVFIPGISGDLRGAILLVGQALAGGLVRPMLSIIATVLYFDLRVRREALEVDVLAYQAAAPQPPPLA